MNKQKIKLIPALSGLLAVQLLLALVLGLSGHISGDGAQSPLISADIGTIDKIRIEDGAGGVTILQKVDQQWRIPDVSSFPADDEKIRNLLDALSGLRTGWPAGTTDAAAKRFKVAADGFERKLVLYKQDQAVAQIYAGNAAAFKKTYVRLDGSDDIFVGEINAYELFARPDEWIEREILQQDPAKIASIRLPGLSLQRDDQGLRISDLKANQQTVTDQAEALLGKIANLKIQEVLGTEAKPDFGQSQPTHSIGLTLKDGSTIEYTISQPKDKGYYVLKSSSRPEYFKVPTYTLDPIFDTKREQLVEAKPPQADANKAS
ncbi:MAG TPA: DUF4340 domain-containing protein [Gammaproteobacteria bacterium]|nr:DUF4340 domain-containing protein [Gammaproteobacteria bacterium]